MEEEQSAAIRSIDEPGVRAEGDMLRGMRQEVARLLQRNTNGFPGAQPISFARKHIEELQREDYYLCEKSDGIRYLLYATEDQGNEIHYLIDRKNDYYYVNNGNLHFPLPNKEAEFHRDTILDGELVVDTLPNGKKQITFLVFDCLTIDGQILMNRDLSKRLGYFRENLFVPYKTLLSKYPEERQFQPFFVEMKDMQLPYGIEAMFKDMIPKLRHGNDGLIFTCLKSDYKPGTDPHILKWKDADENSIDFKWHLSWATVEPDAIDRAEGVTAPYTDWEAVPQVDLLVYHGGQDGYQHFAEMHLEDEEWETLKSLGDPLNDRIVEAYMDEQKRWRFSRFRDDKTDANHISTVRSVIDSIRDGVTKDDLLAAAASIRQHWKARH